MAHSNCKTALFAAEITCTLVTITQQVAATSPYPSKMSGRSPFDTVAAAGDSHRLDHSGQSQRTFCHLLPRMCTAIPNNNGTAGVSAVLRQ